jgi:hypothetical protein
LKDPGAVALVLRLISDADALIEGFRPASPSAGIGSDACFERNPSWRYGRMTGLGVKPPAGGGSGPRYQLHRNNRDTQCDRPPSTAPSVPINIIGDMAEARCTWRS